MNSAVAPFGTALAMSQFTIWADRMPMTIVSWLVTTSRPRICAGATSAIYIGDRLEARPMATPPRIRNETNQLKLDAQPVRTEDTANSRAATTSKRLRPNLSLIPPERTAPARPPGSAQLLAQPRSDSRVRLKNGSKKRVEPAQTPPR